MSSILIVDDEKFFRERLIKAMERRGFTVFAAANYDEAIDVIKREQIAKAIIDLKMPGRSGLDIISTVNELNLAIKMVVLTGYGSIATAIEAVQLGAIGYVSKPADVEEILAAFQNDKEQNRPLKQNTKEISVPSLARVEWEHINRILNDCDGNISKAAKKLGLHRRSLQRKLLKYPPKQ